MTVYIPHIHELPRGNMCSLDPAAQCSVIEAEGVVTAFAYDWPDLRVVIHLTSGPELEQPLQGFLGYVRRGCAGLRKPVDPSFERRILSTTLVLGFVVERKTKPDEWRDRVYQMIGMIAYNTSSLVFWEGAVLDENSNQLFPP